MSNVAGVVTSTVATLTYTGNANPVANPASVSRNAGMALQIPISSLGWTDADLDTLSLTAASSTNGAMVTYDSTNIYYSNPNNVTDEIDYTISDGNGGTASSYITVTITPQPVNASTPALNSDGTITLQFAGTPYFTYWVEAATNLISPVWEHISTNTAGNDGLWNITNTGATNYPIRFYRTEKP